MILYVILSIIGIFSPEIVYSLLLYDITLRFETLKNVIRSVTHNIK